MTTTGDPISTREFTTQKFAMGAVSPPIVAPVVATSTGKSADDIISALQLLGIFTQT